MAIVVQGVTPSGVYKKLLVDDVGSMFVPSPSSPVLTVYTPSGAAYMKVTPTAAARELSIRPRTVAESLIYAPLVTHKIADTTTTIAAADADDLAKSKTLADELLADVNTHMASLVYHVTAPAVWYAGHKEDDATNTASQANMSSLATGYVLADELDDDVTAHLASVVFHIAATTATDFGGTPAAVAALTIKTNLLRTAMIAHFGSATVHSVADPINAALATATTAGSDEATTQTLINLLKTYWNSHCAVGDATADDLAAVIVCANAAKAGILAHMADSATAHGGTGDATNAATLTAVAAASDAATSYALLNAEKATYNAHCAIVDGGAYATVGSSVLPMRWACLGSLFCKTSGPGVFTVTEFRNS